MYWFLIILNLKTSLSIKFILFKTRGEGVLYQGGLILEVIFCLQVDGPITGGAV